MDIKQHQNNTKNNLLIKAFNLIESKGYDNVSINEICKELGLTKGAFYHYFRSKSDIILKRYKIAEAELLSYYNDRLHLPADKQLRTIFDWYIDYFSLDRLEESKAFSTIQFQKYYKNYPYTNKTQRMIIQNIIDKGIKEGCFDKHLDAKKTSDFIFNHLLGILSVWNAHHGRLDFGSELNNFYEEFLIKYILPPK